MDISSYGVVISNVVHEVLKQQDKVKAKGKYPKPVHHDNHTMLEWTDHKIQELVDALVYEECQRLKLIEISALLQDALTSVSMEECHNLIETALSRLGK
jgi:uncharacterized protein YaaR (DUF327 family)